MNVKGKIIAQWDIAMLALKKMFQLMWEQYREIELIGQLTLGFIAIMFTLVVSVSIVQFLFSHISMLICLCGLALFGMGTKIGIQRKVCPFSKQLPPDIEDYCTAKEYTEARAWMLFSFIAGSVFLIYGLITF